MQQISVYRKRRLSPFTLNTEFDFLNAKALFGSTILPAMAITLISGFRHTQRVQNALDHCLCPWLHAQLRLPRFPVAISMLSFEIRGRAIDVPRRYKPSYSVLAETLEIQNLVRFSRIFDVDIFGVIPKSSALWRAILILRLARDRQ